MVISEDQIKARYPLHYLVWKNEPVELQEYLSAHHGKELDVEQKDHRHRTPLMLAATLDRQECAAVLLKHNALVNVTDYSGFNVLHEAVTTADPKFIRDIYLAKKLQSYSIRVDGIPSLLSKICDTSDFYIEMKWEFSSWVPLISRLCPTDTYKIYKRGSKVRFDSTLIGLTDTINWQRGHKSFIFTGSEHGGVFLEVDHDQKTVQKRTMEIIQPDEVDDYIEVTEEQIADRLATPIKTSYIDTEKICFERAKSGIYGFRSDRVETLNGYECKVYWAQNVEFLTKTRIEHLTQEDKNRYQKAKDSTADVAFRSLIGIHEQNIPNPFANEPPVDPQWRRNPYQLTLTDYFELAPDDPRDIGSPRELKVKKQYFKANLWMADQFPLSLQEQILPIVDMMAITSTHFAKLRDFITCKLPIGFPLKIEIPLFHLLNAKITFENVFAHNEPVDGVHLEVPTGAAVDQSSSLHHSVRCTVDDRCFDPPADYELIGNERDDLMLTNDHHHGVAGLDDDDYLNFILAKEVKQQNAVVQSEPASVPTTTGDQAVGTEQLSIMEALSYDSEKDLQRAIQLSLMEYNNQQQQQRPPPRQQLHANGSVVRSAISSAERPSPEQDSSSTSSYASCDNDDTGDGLPKNRVKEETEEERVIRLTLERSKRDHEEQLRRRQQEEEELFDQVLKLSLTDK